MNTDTLVLILATVLKFAFGAAVLVKNPRGEINRLWFTFVVCVVLWGFGDISLRISDYALAAGLFHRIGGIGFALFPAVFFHFALVLSERVRLIRTSLTLILIYGSALAMTMFHTMGYITSIDRDITGFTVIHGTGYAFYRIWLLACFAAGLAALLGRLKRLQSNKDRVVLASIILAIALPLVSIVFIDVFQPAGISQFYFIHIALFAGAAVVSVGLLRWSSIVPTPREVAERVSETTGDLVCVINLDGYLTFAAEAFRRVLGLGESESGKPVHLREFMQESEIVLQLTKTMTVSTKPGTLEVHYRTRKGETFPVSLSVAPLLQKSLPAGLILIGRDISERRELTRRYEESEEKYQHIVESSLDGIVVIQQDRLVFVNPSAVRIFGYTSAEEMTAMSFQDTVAPGSKPFLVQDFTQRRVGESIFRNYEMKGLSKKGHVIDLELSAKLVSWNGRPAILASFRDITERKKLEKEQALWFWEQESLMTIDRQLVAMVDLESVLQAVTLHASSFTRAELSGVIMAQEQSGVYAWQVVRGNIQPARGDGFPLLEAHRTIFRSKEPVVLTDLSGSPEAAGPFPVFLREQLVTAALFPFQLEGDRRGLLVVGFRSRHDFSDRELRLLSSLAEKSAIALTNAELYDNLRSREKELEHLSNSRLATQEEERRRIARELHDGLGQMLTAVKFNVEMLEDSSGFSAVEKKKLKEIKGLLDNVMTEAREISYDLMPSVLDDFGLAPAIQLFCETISKRMNIEVRFQSHGVNGRLEPSLEVNLYRIAQEALNNVVKHAAAKSVHIQILGSESGIRMTVEDDGKGFVRPIGRREGTTKGGMGLVSMRERVQSFGGSFYVESNPGKGTTLIIEVPHHEAGSKTN